MSTGRWVTRGGGGGGWGTTTKDWNLQGLFRKLVSGSTMGKSRACEVQRAEEHKILDRAWTGALGHNRLLSRHKGRGAACSKVRSWWFFISSVKLCWGFSSSSSFHILPFQHLLPGLLRPKFIWKIWSCRWHLKARGTCSWRTVWTGLRSSAGEGNGGVYAGTQWRDCVTDGGRASESPPLTGMSRLNLSDGGGLIQVNYLCFCLCENPVQCFSLTGADGMIWNYIHATRWNNMNYCALKTHTKNVRKTKCVEASTRSQINITHCSFMAHKNQGISVFTRHCR